MQFKIFLLSALAAVASARSWGQFTADYDGRGGKTEYRSDRSGQCVSFDQQQTDWNNRIRWIKVDHGTCTFYFEPNCQGEYVRYRHGGDHHNLRGRADRSISSWSCVD